MLLPFIVLIGAMFLLTRSAKKKQQQAVEMRNQMQPGSGVRTIGGMYATVKELSEDTVLLEVAPGVHAVYAKNAIGAVLSDEEYNRIVHGDTEGDEGDIKITGDAVPDDVSSLTEKDDDSEAKTDLTKKADPAEAGAETEVKDGKADGDTDAK
ncbi:preprotein translocase subunit YajC [Streptomyces tritici]|uniref:preprotein translocase subunit YajC n=1 Tax=Streptomyces tritici TaxID=2054410 RepID=UPI003AEF40A1